VDWRRSRASAPSLPTSAAPCRPSQEKAARNSGLNGHRAARADRLATARTARTARPRAGKLADEPGLRLYVEDKLALRWSPEQISQRLLVDLPCDLGMRVSHETIYTSLFAQTKAVLRSELTTHLRSKRVRRRPQRRTTVAGRSGRIPNMVPIQVRPAEVLERTVPEHWAGDLLVGRYNRSHLVTLVERHSRYLFALALADARTSTVVAALTETFQDLPAAMRGSLTWDRGIEIDVPRGLQSRHRCVRLLLRRVQPLAAWQQREHPWPPPAVLPEEDGPVADDAEQLPVAATSSTTDRAEPSDGRLRTRSTGEPSVR
jgi:IS30 family transposase